MQSWNKKGANIKSIIIIQFSCNTLTHYYLCWRRILQEKLTQKSVSRITKKKGNNRNSKLTFHFSCNYVPIIIRVYAGFWCLDGFPNGGEKKNFILSTNGSRNTCIQYTAPKVPSKVIFNMQWLDSKLKHGFKWNSLLILIKNVLIARVKHQTLELHELKSSTYWNLIQSIRLNGVCLPA